MPRKKKLTEEQEMAKWVREHGGVVDPEEKTIDIQQLQELLHKYGFASSRSTIERLVRAGKLRYMQCCNRSPRNFALADAMKLIRAAYMRKRYAAHKAKENPAE